MLSRLHLMILVPVAAVAGSGAAATTRMTSPANPADSAAVVAVVNEFHNALSTGDSARALTLLSPNATILESGEAETRSEYRSHHLAADIAFARAVRSNRRPIRVTLNGTTAWTAGTSTTQGEFNGRAINSVGAESMVLTMDGSSWRIRSIHWSSRNRRPPAP